MRKGRDGLIYSICVYSRDCGLLEGVLKVMAWEPLPAAFTWLITQRSLPGAPVSAVLLKMKSGSPSVVSRQNGKTAVLRRTVVGLFDLLDK